MICSHLVQQNFLQSVQGTKIYKDQCTRCFYEPEDQNGIFVCLKCLQGQCQQHVIQHKQQQNHILYLNIKKTLIPQEIQEQASDKLQILDNSPKYDTQFQLYCSECQKYLQMEIQLEGLVQSIIKSDSAFQQSNLDTWELEIIPCEHSLCIQQIQAKQIEDNKMAHCGDCNLSSNLWLCLTCGYLGCGRKYFDGTGLNKQIKGGNNHAIEHSKSLNHPCVVKLGTISAEGNASVHCYSCDDEVKDHYLQEHLENFGIKIDKLVKTEKTIMEMTLDLNLNLQLSKTMEEGKILKNIYGPNLTGLQNLGNSCYINSVLQLLFSIPDIQQKYQDIQHINNCKQNPEECIYCQIQKLSYGLQSGVYSQPIDQDDSQKGLKIQSFKQLIGKGHQEFQSNKQQDASEYLQHLFSKIQKMEKQYNIQETSKLFEFQIAQKITCCQCQGYKLKENTATEWKINCPYQKSDEEYPVQFDQLIQNQTQYIEFNCPNCKQQTQFQQDFYFKTLPKYIIVQVQRFALENWVPTKIQAYLENIQQINLESLLFQEPSQDQFKLPDNNPQDEVNQEYLQNLLNMGFEQNKCIKALKVNKNDLEKSIDWLFNDNSMDDLIEPQDDSQNENLAIVISMGFSEKQGKFALKQCDNNVERAIDYLFSHPDCGQEEDQPNIQFSQNSNYELIGSIVHLGKSVHCGHYVSYCKQNNKWVYFNDAKVAESQDPYIGRGYILVYKQNS